MLRHVIALLAPVLLLSISGCVFLDDETDIRGYTECGSFLGGESCSPGQYCEDPTFSECDNGCLSDVNCASNQYCYKTGGQNVGICENTRSSYQALGSADAGIDAASGPDAE